MTSALKLHLGERLAQLEQSQTQTEEKIKEVQGLLGELATLQAKLEASELLNKELNMKYQALQEAKDTSVTGFLLDENQEQAKKFLQAPLEEWAWNKWQEALGQYQNRKNLDGDHDDKILDRLQRESVAYQKVWMASLYVQKVQPWRVYQKLKGIGRLDLFQVAVQLHEIVDLNVDPREWFGDLLQSEPNIPRTLKETIIRVLDISSLRITSHIAIHERPDCPIPVNWTLSLVQRIVNCGLDVVVHNTIEVEDPSPHTLVDVGQPMKPREETRTSLKGLATFSAIK